MIRWVSASRLGVGRFSRPLRGVGVLAIPYAGQDTTRRVESVCKISLGAAVPQLLVPGLVVRVFIDRRSIADGVKANR